MRDPDEYADRVRTHPYGPVEIIAGPIATWLHGPYVVMTLAGSDGGGTMIAGAADDACLANDLAEFFESAAQGSNRELPDASRLTVEQPASRDQAERVTRWHADIQQDRHQLVLHAGVTIIAIQLGYLDLAVHAETLRAWADAIGLDSQIQAAGAQPPGPAAS